MKKLLLLVTAAWVLGVCLDAVAAAPRRASARRSSGTRELGARVRPAASGARRTRPRRASRPVIRHTVVSLPQLRTELSRLESGLQARVQRIEKAVARPPAPPVVIAPPAPPALPPPGLPMEQVALGAGILVLLSGALGFALGQGWGKRSARLQSDLMATEEASGRRPRDHSAGTRPWSHLQQRLEETQQRLSTARARLQRLER